MPDSSIIDETDLAIVHAIERSPRATWAELAALVGVDAATVARRWDRLAGAGLAWVTCYPLLTDETASAIIELICDNGHILSVARRVAADPRALFVDIVTGASDILLTVDCASHQALSNYVLQELPNLAGVSAVRTHPIINVHFEGGYAASGSLEPRALARLPAPERGLLITSRDSVDGLDWDICLALSKDGRRPVSELARETSTSETTVRRRMSHLVRHGLLRYIVELAAAPAGVGCTVWLNVRVSAASREASIRKIAQNRHVKAIASVTGPDNLFVKAGLRHLSTLDAFEASITQAAPDLIVTDRKIVLQPIRNMSRLVDPYGQATTTASVDTRRYGY